MCGGNIKALPSATEMMQVNISPNPAVSDFKLEVITAGKEDINVRISDLQGKMLKQLTVIPYQTINIGTELKAGVYLVETRQDNNVKTTMVVKF